MNYKPPRDSPRLKVYRQRNVPNKLLVFLLFSTLPFITAEGENFVKVAVGPLARHLRISNARLYEALDWLKQNSLIADIIKDNAGTAMIKLIKPRNLSVG